MGNESKESSRSGIRRWAIRGLTFKLFATVVLMTAAGRWDWLMGWLYVVIFLLFDVATAFVALPENPELLIERSDPQGEMQSWDKVLMPLAAGVLPMVSWVVAGLNERFGWQPPVGNSIQAAGLVLTVLGYGVMVWAIWANSYFSPVVRLQIERGHTVVTQGPYQYIRHPGYLGAILFTAAVPLMLGSWWAMIPGLAAAMLYILRTAMEDQFLQENLPGYREYAKRVNDLLIPRIW